MGLAERVLPGIIAANNRRMATGASDADAPNPRPVADMAWARDVAERFPAIRAEWDEFEDRGLRLPRIEDVLAEPQGDDGTWRAGLLVIAGGPGGPLAEYFPGTLETLAGVPGLWSALWSVLEPGTELPLHSGPNAGVLRYHLGVVADGDTGLTVAGTTTRYQEGVGVLFDDTAPHAAWNRHDTRRVTLFCELIRPARGPTALANRAVQRLISRDRRYRLAPARAAEWHEALNPGAVLSSDHRIDRGGR